MSWNSYGLDREAQLLVLNARKRDEELRERYPKAEKSLNEGQKMRTTTAYGLERFWGEHIRYAAKANQAAEKRQWEKQQENANNSLYWEEVWNALATILSNAGVNIPNDDIAPDDTNGILGMSQQLWKLQTQDQRLALAVLNQLCDCMVWWTQRYKG